MQDIAFQLTTLLQIMMDWQRQLLADGGWDTATPAGKQLVACVLGRVRLVDRARAMLQTPITVIAMPLLHLLKLQHWRCKCSSITTTMATMASCMTIPAGICTDCHGTAGCQDKACRQSC